MPVTDPNALFTQYERLLGRFGSNIPQNPSEFRKQMADTPYGKLSDFEKVMLFLAAREEKRTPEDDLGTGMFDFNFANWAKGDIIKRRLIRSYLGFAETIREYAEGEGCLFELDVLANKDLLDSFRGTKDEQLLRDAGAILGRGKEIDKLMSDPESVKRANQLDVLLKRFGYGEADLEKAEPKEVKGSDEYQAMVKKAFEAYRAARDNKYKPEMGESIVQACIAYNKGKKSVRMTEYGRKRFEDSLNLMATFADPDNPGVKANIDRINEVRKTKQGDRNFVDLTRYGVGYALAQANVELLKSTRGKARDTVADLLTGEGARQAKELFRQKHAQEKLNAYRSEENINRRSHELTMLGQKHLKDAWANNIFKIPNKASTSGQKPPEERTAADVVCIHLAQAYNTYQPMKQQLSWDAPLPASQKTYTASLTNSFKKFKTDMAIAYATMRLFKPDALMDANAMSTVRKVSGDMVNLIPDDANEVQYYGANSLVKDGNAVNLLVDLESFSMKNLDRVFNLSDPTGYVMGKNTIDDYLEDKPMTREEHSQSLLTHATGVMNQYRKLMDLNPPGKPITEDMALARNTFTYCCVADKVMTFMYPEKDAVPDMNAVRSKVDTMLKDPDFADRLSVANPDSDFVSRIETLCTRELTRKKDTVAAHL